MPAEYAENAVRPVIELEVVRPNEPHQGGRPLYLTPRRFIRICHMIERGGSAASACRRELVTYRNFRRHVTLNPKYQRRLREAEEIRDHFLLEFHIANIARHAQENLSASLWWLEHRHPNQFALRTVVRTNPSEDKELEAEIPSEVLQRHRALMLELAREDEARAAQKQLTCSASPPDGANTKQLE
jgi:hypothetical protein